MKLTAQEVIETLGLEPHPEGGKYVQTWRAKTDGDARPSGTAIYYLLNFGEQARWHRVDAAEVWHFYAGAPLRLSMSADGENVDNAILGADIAAGERPQIIVPEGAWQSAESLGPWSLVGCTVSPGFTFDAFEMAPPDWRPGLG